MSQINFMPWLRVSFLGISFFLCISCTTSQKQKPSPVSRFPPRESQPSGSGSTIKSPEGQPWRGAQVSPTTHRPRLGIVLGPGGFKTLAQVGVLKELERARIPIDRLVGLEWGALIGGLYASRGQVHDLEWKVYKLEKFNWMGRSFLSNQIKPENVGVLKPYLQDSFSRQELHRLSLPFSCPLQIISNGDLQWAQGDMVSAISHCLAYPPLLMGERGHWAAATAAQAAVQRLRREGADVVIFINVLNQGSLMNERLLPDAGASVVLWNEVRRAVRSAASLVDEWVEVNTQETSLLELSQRREWMAAGEKAGQDVARRLAERFGL